MSIWIEVIESFTVKEHGEVSAWQAGQRMSLTPEQARRVIERVGSKVRVVEHLQMGDLITWKRAGVKRIGQVDFLHVDADGTVWAFVAEGQSWCAVNVKFATVLGGKTE